MPDQPITDKDVKDVERLFLNMERQLQDIETTEIVQGRSVEDLAQKGFIGDKKIEIPRATHQLTTEKEKLVFFPGVEYARLSDAAKFEELQLETFDSQKDAEKGERLAFRALSETTPFEAGHNVVKQKMDVNDVYVATVRGKTLIFQNKMHVLPSDRDCRILLRVSKDKMTVFLDCAPHFGSGVPLTIGNVKDALQKAHVVFGIDFPQAEMVIAAANQTRKPFMGAAIAHGKPAIPGRTGEVVYQFDLKHQKQDFKILPDGRIDYKNSTNILMAQKGDVLAVLTDPGPGEDGADVFGEKILGEAGRPAKLLPGRGVKAAMDGKSFLATVGGSIIINGSVLEVLETYLVNSDIDFATGNIDFNGTVIITGDVKDGFEVNATGDIVIMKNVESARVVAGRDITIKGGVLSKGKGLVSAGRDITVDYVQNARLEAQGHIYIENFAVNSYICTSRSLKMQNKRGTILGGEVYAQKGLDVRILGSDSGKKTFVEAGTDFLVLKRIFELEEAIRFTETNIVKINTVIRPVMELARTQPQVLKEKQEILKKTLEKRKELELQQSTMQQRLSDLQEQLNDKEAAVVKVSVICHPDVQIKIKELKMLVMRPQTHKMFYADAQAGEVKVAEYA
ncbi:MAG: FapA family protein [Fibrobacterota bacterium]